MGEQNLPPIIIIRKKINHAGHHGGAWKVAYADFVTAMMALFIVLWLLSSSADIKESVSAYFNDPSGSGKLRGSSVAGAGESLALAKDDMENLKDKLDQALKQSPNFEKLKNNVVMSVTGDGLRVELLESDKGMFFQSGNAAPSETGKALIVKLAEELGKLPNDLLIEGHTDSKAFGVNTEYTNWELSSDRANSARRLMEKSGLRPQQVVQVRGFADHNLRNVADPNAAANRRVSVIVRYLDLPPAAGAKAGKHGEPSKEGGAKEGGAKEGGAKEIAASEKKAEPKEEPKH
ncbi:MAG: flagellar motor protein MotB [Acidobacteriota bacterium]